MNVKRIFDFSALALEKFPNEDCLVTKKNGKWIKTSTMEFVNQGNKISRGLLKLGIKPGDKIGLVTANNITEWAIMDLGISQIGVVTVPVYPTISEEDYIYIFNNSEIKYCFVSDKDLYKKLTSAKAQIPSLVGVFTFDDIDGAPNWNEILDLGENDLTQDEVDDLAKAINPEDIATIIYTSGTTGKPKGVPLTHNNLVANVLASTPRIPKDKSLDYKELKALSFLPICHVFERMIFYLYLSNGISIYFAESIEKIGENVKEVKPHYMTVVPRLVEKVYDSIYNKGTAAGGLKSKIFLWSLGIAEKYEIEKPRSFMHTIADKLVFKKWREGLGGNLITLVSGSAALSKRLNVMFHAAGIPILEGYGLTETSPVISVNSFGKVKAGSVGIPLENVKVRIESDGEIVVKGPSVFAGYYQDEEKTNEAFTSDGYFKTGDIGMLDEDNFLFITDRKKEMFKTSGGKFIAPQVIENLAKASKFIEQIMVVGDGEKMPCALVQPDFNYTKTWAELHNVKISDSHKEIAANPAVKSRIEKEIENMNQHLGKWEQIKKIELTPKVWTIDDGLLTPTLKLKRKAIKAEFQDLYDRMYK
ncbi:long-chain fatty acid--CoA ligase [Epilithonimonas ginsengisoli]|uniref:Long-chain fatty acid--CoA ligase n=1 Tax=Epilithonimonas ginsengisoli TaxID=1245592 RepID=A0ABU4JDN7_9FLAO|nr:MULTISPECIES: long-chain fatty acid--CoA ligase [Chryseobacterium group]MBV6878641.1 long-chain fatty acid--CoA ligase [Epilithonimonas sp. FP105]MDW8547666.1 long-chain fatty acid--CoA ligase [Epilithonimonas ginsengisoli]OAH75256.1 AMP-dependent synthetase [Chryseobacterium sp. FP211-J200]